MLPHIAHAPLEPVNATASYRNGTVEIWGSIQSVTACQEAVAQAVGCAVDDVKINVTFLGGSFYSIDMLPPFWQKVALLNPVVYLISGFRWSFYGAADVHVGISVAMTLGFLGLCLLAVWWVFKTGYKLKS